MKWVITALCLFSTGPALAQFETPPITLVKPGAGFLAADGVSVIPLEAVFTGEGKIKGARVRAEAGSIDDTRVVTTNRVQFMYRVPKRSGEQVEDLLDINLEMSNGDLRSVVYPLVLTKPTAPEVTLTSEPEIFDAESPTVVSLSATARGRGLETLRIFSDAGTIAGEAVTGDGPILRATAKLQPPALPPDAPSYLALVAVASGADGFGFRVGGVSVRAPVRISVQIPPGSQLAVEGAEQEKEPVTAAADGRTVMDDVVIRYGSDVKAFVVEESGIRPLSVVLPTGLVSAGVVAPIPGQTVADGGVGPTLLVAVPPSALGGEIFWPEIEVDGARLVEAVDAGADAKVLILERPVEASTVRVLLDDIVAGEVAFSAARGIAMSLDAVPAERDERGAVVAVVKDPRGEPTDLPVPKIRVAGGESLAPRRIGPGRYRASIPPGSPGNPGDTVEVLADLPPAPVIQGDALELVSASTELVLVGPPPVVSKEATTEDLDGEKEEDAAQDTELAVGIGAAGLVGATFGSLFMVGGGLQLEVRMPFLEQRLGVRTGAEFVHHSGRGNVTFADTPVEAKTRIAGFLIPLEIGFAVVRTEAFELLVRGGGELRIERGAISVAGDSPGAGSGVRFSGRAGADAALRLSAGDLSLGVTFGGLGANASGLSTPNARLSGSLINARADLAYRIWF